MVTLTPRARSLRWREGGATRHGARAVVLMAAATAAAALTLAGLWVARSSGGAPAAMMQQRHPHLGGAARQQAASATPTPMSPGSAAAATAPLSPQHRFLLFFSGHQGSSALADMLGSLPEVFIPGFEPLDVAGLAPAAKLSFLRAAFAFPRAAPDYLAWRAALVASGARINRTALDRGWSALKGKRVAGFKLRPYVADDWGGNRSHTAASGLDPAELRAVLQEQRVVAVLTLRRNRVKEALSWYRAREAGLRQFGRRDGQQAPAAGAPVNLTALQGWIKYSTYVNTQLQQAATFLGLPTLTMWYEDFLADPVGEAARAATFVGADPTLLRESARFLKATPDALRDAVTNFDELCAELWHTEHQQLLVGEGCQQEGSAPAAAAAARASPAPSVALAPVDGPSLLRYWCAAVDKQAAQWGDVSDAACVVRVQRMKKAATMAARITNATVLFKHVHKASAACALPPTPSPPAAAGGR